MEQKKRIRFTAQEAHILRYTAGNFKDDFIDHFRSMEGLKEAERLYKIYESAMYKLSILERRNPPNK